MIETILTSPSVVVVVAGLLIIAFAKSIIKIYRMGQMSKAQLVERQEFNTFQNEMRKEMREYCVQIQKIVTQSAMTVIQNKLKDIEDAKKAAVDLKVMKAEIDANNKHMLDKFDEVHGIVDNVKILNNKVQRLEYGQQQPIGTIERRSEK